MKGGVEYGMKKEQNVCEEDGGRKESTWEESDRD